MQTSNSLPGWNTSVGSIMFSSASCSTVMPLRSAIAVSESPGCAATVQIGAGTVVVGATVVVAATVGATVGVGGIVTLSPPEPHDATTTAARPTARQRVRKGAA
jgi:hypothetical protein